MFATANGVVPTHDYVTLRVPEVNEVVKPWVLNNTPAVLSIGQRCMEMGYTFIWPTGSVPYFMLPSGEFLYLEVRDNIPYIRKGSSPTRAAPPALPVAVFGGSEEGAQACSASGVPAPIPSDPAPAAVEGGDVLVDGATFLAEMEKARDQRRPVNMDIVRQHLAISQLSWASHTKDFFIVWVSRGGGDATDEGHHLTLPRLPGITKLVQAMR